MMRALIVISLFAFISLPTGSTYAQNTKHPIIDERGAVLCTWSIYVILKAIGSNCFSDRDKAILTATDSAILRMDQFIKRNSKATDKDLVARKAQLKIQALTPTNNKNSGACNIDSESLNFYELFATGQSPLDIQKYMDELLAVDRPPVINPCL